MSDFIEVLSPEALSDLQKANVEVLKLIQNINSAGAGLGGLNTPSQSTEAIRKLNEDLKKQEQIIKDLQSQLTLLAQARTRNNTQTAEESVNQGILNRNARQSALANSQLAGAYANLSAQQNIASRTVQDLIARGRQSTQTQREYNRELRNAQNEFNQLNRRVLQADTAVGRFNRNVGNYPKQAILGIKNLLGAFGVVGGVALIASMTKSVYEQVKAQQSLDLALKQVTGTYEENIRAQAFLKEQAELNGAEINSLTTAYTKFYVSAKDKIATKEIEGIFGSITKAGSTMGLTVENQERAFTALNQMFSKGTVQAEELKTQLGDALPGAIGIMTRAYQKLHPELKVNEASFAKLMKDGKILASEVLPEFARELERTYGIENVGRIENLATAQNRLTNSFKDFIDALNTGDGVIGNFFARVSNGLSNNINKLSQLVKSDAQNARDRNEKVRLNAYNDEIEVLQKLSGEQRKLKAEEDKIEAERNLKNRISEKNTLNKNLGWDASTGTFSNEVNQEDVDSLREYNAAISHQRGILAGIKKVMEETNEVKKEDEGLTKKQIDDAKKRLEEELKNQYELKRLRLEANKTSLDDLLENEKEYISTRLELLENATDEEMKLAKLRLDEDLRLSKGNLTQQKIAWQKYTDQIYDIQKENEKKTLKLKEDYLDSYYEYRAKFQGEGLKFEVDPIADEWFEEQAEKAKKLEERTKELKNQTKEYLNSFSLGFFEEAGLGSLNKFFDQTLDPLTGKMQSTFDKLWEGAETTKEKFAVTFTAITEVVQEAMTFINQQQQAYFDAQYSRLEKEKDTAILFAGESASAKEEVERQYEEQRRGIRMREAKAQKETALFNAIINTAQAVVAFLAQANYAGAILAGVIGAAQISLIESQTLPEYWKGTDNAPEGMAWVDERGPELHLDRYGKIKSLGSDKGANMRFLEKGDKIIPHHKFEEGLNNILLSNGISNYNKPTQNASSGLNVNDVVNIVKSSQNQSQSSIHIDKNGFRHFIQSASGQQQILNDTISIKVNKL